MNRFTKLQFFALLASSLCILSCNGQSQQTLQSSEDLENTNPELYKMPATIYSSDTSAGWKQNGQKLLVTGTVFKNDGKTPAPGVIVYYYQTNTEGKYLHKPEEPRSFPPNKLGQTHGYIRGWVKTGTDGKYSIYTVRPGTYPSRSEPAHIHLTIKETQPEKSYYIDDLVFDDDPLLTTARRNKNENRGGSGVLRVLLKGELQIAEHNIILGLNIPGYQSSGKADKQSGLSIGEDNPSFTPYHAFGPDKGSRTCPVCKYGRYHGIVYFVGNHPNWLEIKKWLVFLEQESTKRDKYLKAYFVYGNSVDYTESGRRKELEQLGEELSLKHLALTFVPAMDDRNTEVNLNKINPEVTNTFVIYKNRTIVDKYIDLQPTSANFKMLCDVLDKTRGDYFELQTPPHN